MNYFAYLRITGREDTQKSFINYLIDILNYTEEEAEKESQLYYKD